MANAKNDKTTNLDLWNRLEPTNPKYTKTFKGKGGFSGTAINGTYIIRRLTEEFGPCGTGWRFFLDQEQIVEGHTLKNGDKAKLHIVRGHIEYREHKDLDWSATSPQFGQTMLVDENKYGTFMDEEAPKKSITDCISKCAVLLGIAADVHLGMFDDSKYVNQRKTEEAEANGESVQPPAQAAAAAPAGAAVSDDDMNIARQVFSLVKSTAEKAKDIDDINECLKNNGAALKALERASPANYEGLKKIVQDARTRLKPVDPELNEDPAFINER